MISTGIDKVFQFVWGLMKLNLMFLCLSLMGGILLGIGPASQTISDLIYQNQLDYEKNTWKVAFGQYRKNFVKSNVLFYAFSGALAIILYNLYVSSQLLGIIWLMLDFILFFMALLVILVYFYLLLFEASYEMKLKDSLKLAFISLFLNFGGLLKLIFGLVSLFFLTMQMKGLLLFVSFSLLFFWLYVSTKKNREVIDQKIVFEQ